jgi:hypothetical protein
MKARALLVVGMIALSGCAIGQPVASTPPSSALTGSASTTPTVGPSEASSPRATPSASSPTPTPTTPAAKPVVPSKSGALNVTSFGQAHFASPSGRIWCAMDSDGVLCHFPKGMNMTKVPTPDQVCPGEGLDVTGVNASDEVGYFCSGGVESLPQTDGEYVDWWKPTAWASVKYDGWTLATLPYGKKLRLGDFVCSSANTGITCGNTATGQGFSVAVAGVTLIE